MSSSAITTVVQILEDLPEAAQRQVVDHLREYLEDLRDEIQWDDTIARTQPQLAEAARRAKREIAQGLAEPLDLERL
ncbi:MAG: hypothetical protein HUU46_06220 [Candidatus Hydrogenedentes bacterium]|nr:hypothetical protein [Candidatus Hydrogenedentota bacterium]